MEIEPSRSAERAQEMLRDPDRYFTQARERAERDLRALRSPMHDSDPGTSLSRVPSRDYPSTNSSVLERWGRGAHKRAHLFHEVTLSHLPRVLGDDHPDTLASASDLAAELRALGCDEQARQLEAWMRTRR
ncbi:MAG: hypothetical protein ACT4NY_16525 [Pseudonocardiales bacterium]